jgi:DNA-binding Xre family transcriptional regulator
MGATKQIRQLLIEKDLKIKDLADLLEIKEQSARNKLYRDTFSYEEVERIADLLNCDVRIIMRDTRKEF